MLRNKLIIISPVTAITIIIVIMSLCSHGDADEGERRGINKESAENGKTMPMAIKWRRLVSDGQTCPRCGSTEAELSNATAALKQCLAPLAIEVVLEKEEISLARFRENPIQSNLITIDGKPLEEWLGAQVGQSPCCAACAGSECRTLEIKGETYEAIPSELIIKAGFLAAAARLGAGNTVTHCEDKIPVETKPSSGGCCPK